MESVGASVVLCATISSLPFGTELLVAGFGEQVEADVRGEGVMSVVPSSCCCAFQNIMFVSAEADGADGQDDGDKVIELLLLGWVLGAKGPHFLDA